MSHDPIPNVFAEIGYPECCHLLYRIVDSPSPLEYASELDAEGEVDTNNSYMTPAMSSPVWPEEPIIGDAVDGPGEPAEDHLVEAGTLVPIEEIEEVPDLESEEVPGENEEPLQIREQPPAYSPVHGQQAMHGGRVNGPYNFHRHIFPYTASADARPVPTYFQWEITPSKRQRSEDWSGGKDDRVVKRA